MDVATPESPKLKEPSKLKNLKLIAGLNELIPYEEKIVEEGKNHLPKNITPETIETTQKGVIISPDQTTNLDPIINRANQ